MHRSLTAGLSFAAAAALAVAGYREFHFLTDDAYISFRYAANALAGHGLVWNPAPFLPVEGYTNFAWVMLLGGVWAAFGIEPPAAANPIALLFGLASLGLATLLLLRAPLPRSYEPQRSIFIGLALLGIVSNRTFLTWLSSGLETSLFNFALLAWIAAALVPPTSRTPATTLSLTLSAALAALTRPDGALLVIASGALALLDVRARRWPTARTAWAWAPLLLPLAHLLWRRAYYGAWVPNTWYAKHLGAWPESGLRYAASFALEYAVWLWLGFVLLWLSRRPRISPQAGLVVTVVTLHFAYYTFSIGGDHFEYRVYSHLIALLFVSTPWLLGAAGVPCRSALFGLSAFVLLSWPIPWTHHLATRDLATRSETHELLVPVAPRLPAPLSWLARPFDTLQAWLIPRHVGMRQREHAVFQQELARGLPSRTEGAQIPWDERPVVAAGNVGMVGWRLPHVAVLDVLGLNDYVVARTPLPFIEERKMAHDRLAPPGYVRCYRPNVAIDPSGRVSHLRREPPLTDPDITACEEHWRKRAGEPIVVPPGMKIKRL